MKNYKYSFDDWLNDQIIEKIWIPENQEAFRVTNELSWSTNMVKEGLISEDVSKRIVAYQQRAFDLSLEYNLKSAQNVFTNKYDRSPDRLSLIKLHKEQNQQLIEKHPNEYTEYLNGRKRTWDILGSKCKKIHDTHSKIKNEELIDAVIKLNDNHQIWHSQRFNKWLIEFEKNVLENPSKSMFHIGDPDKGGRPVSYWDFMNSWNDQSDPNTLLKVNPTHDCEKLKEYRYKQFKELEKKFVSQRELNHLDTTSNDYDIFQKHWLRGEKLTVEKWLEGKNDFSTHVELIKYQEYIEKMLALVDDPLQNDVHNFQSIFKSDDHYKKFISILCSENLIDEITNTWIDTEKGNKQHLAAIIKDLPSKGYCKENLRLTHELIKQMIIDHFNISIGLDTIKRARTSHFDLNYIVYYSE